MVINKENASSLGFGDLYVHDHWIRSFEFDIQEKSLTIKISEYRSAPIKLVLQFKNVFELSFSSVHAVIVWAKSQVLGWEAIPNQHTEDNFIEEIKNKCLANDGLWNDDFFAVRFLMADFSEIKIICESIDASIY